MIELLTSPEAWAALLTLTALEIVLGAKDLNHKSETSELGVGIRNIYEMGCSLTPFFRVAVWGLQNYFWAPCFR